MKNWFRRLWCRIIGHQWQDQNAGNWELPLDVQCRICGIKYNEI